MTLIKKSGIHNVTGISDNEKRDIINFLQGAVYCWCKNRKSKWFALRDLMGGDNYYWEGTPMCVLYDKHHKDLGKSSDDAVKGAAKDAGWLLKRMLDDDKRHFHTNDEGYVNQYLWDGDPSNETS